jgi:glycine/D-amino acid oxidase-like deaminating enzyme
MPSECDGSESLTRESWHGGCFYSSWSPAREAATLRIDAKTVSYWRASCPPAHRPPLAGDEVTQVAVIGAGIAGLSVAYALARDGRAVHVIDSGPIGGGMTHRTSAHLSNAIDDRFLEIERRHGTEGARGCAESHTSAIDYIAAAISRERIECSFAWVDGFLFCGRGGADDVLKEELAAAHRAGLQDVTVARSRSTELDRGTMPAISSSGPIPPAAICRGARRRCGALRRADQLRHHGVGYIGRRTGDRHPDHERPDPTRRRRRGRDQQPRQ